MEQMKLEGKMIDDRKPKKKMSSRTKTRNWCFTWWNYTEDSIKHIEALANNTRVKYVQCQEEVAPTTGKHHLQGFIIFVNEVGPKSVKSVLDNACHIEMMNGSIEDNLKYCSKDESKLDGGRIIKVGDTPTGRGSRSDLKECAKAIIDGHMTVKELMYDHPELYLQYRNGWNDLENVARGKARDFKTKVEVYYGASGTGKTRKAVDENKDCYMLRRSNGSNVWFDGYEYNDTVIIDDFYNWIPFDMMLRLLDRYAMQVDVKGGSMQFNSKKIIITSNKSPLEWYPNLSTEHKIALLRRIDCVHKYTHKQGIIDLTENMKEYVEMMKMDADDEDSCDELMQLHKSSMKKNKSAVNTDNIVPLPSVVELPHAGPPSSSIEDGCPLLETAEPVVEVATVPVKNGAEVVPKVILTRDHQPPLQNCIVGTEMTSSDDDDMTSYTDKSAISYEDSESSIWTTYHWHADGYDSDVSI